MKIQIIDIIKTWLTKSPEFPSKLLYSLVVILLFWVIHHIIIFMLNKRIDDVKRTYVWKKTLGYIFTLIVFILVGRMWFKGIQSVATFLGLLSAGLAIALKDIITDFAGWLFIMWERPFFIGDRIKMENYSGDVLDIGIFKFSLLEVSQEINKGQSTGRMLHIPNAKIFSWPIINFTMGFEYMWDELPILITFESDWKLAEKILAKVINKNINPVTNSDIKKQFDKAKYKHMVHYKNLTPTIYVSVESHGVLLTIRYLCKPREYRDIRHRLWKIILDEFKEKDTIDFAYSTTRIYRMNEEKPQ